LTQNSRLAKANNALTAGHRYRGSAHCDAVGENLSSGSEVEIGNGAVF